MITAISLAVWLAASPIPFNPQIRTVVAAGGSGQDFSDTFTGTDNTTVPNWSEPNGNVQRINNKLSNVSTTGQDVGIYASATDTVEQYMKATVTSFNSLKNTFFIMRYVDATSPLYIIELNAQDDVVTWFSAANVTSLAGRTQIGTSALTAVTGNSYGVTVSGTGTSTTVRIWLNPTGDTPTSASVWGGAGPNVTLTDDPGTACDTGKGGGLAFEALAAHGPEWDTWFFGDI